MKNKDVIELFLQKKKASGSNLYSDGERLINYSTTLAQWHDNYHLIVNNTRYLVSTSTNQNWLKRAITSERGIVVKDVYNIPIDTKNLEQYTNWYVL